MVSKIKKNKGKRAFFDTLISVVSIFLVIITVLISFKVLNIFKTGISENNSSSVPQEARNIINTNTEKYPKLFDNVIFFTLLFVIIASLVAAFLIDVHPIFFILLVVLVFGATLIIIILNNSFETIVSNTFQSEISFFTKTSWILSHLPIIFVIWYFAVGIVTYAKIKTL